MNIKYDVNMCCKVLVDDNWLWHMRFGYYNFERIKFPDKSVRDKTLQKAWIRKNPILINLKFLLLYCLCACSISAKEEA